MDVRCQLAAVINLDRCLGCQTCSLACKKTWTCEPGSEYMWWINVESRPGHGYPAGWEDQERYRGGWVKHERGLKLRTGGRLQNLAELFHNPSLPVLDSYPEYWIYRFSDACDPHPPVTTIVSPITHELADPALGAGAEAQPKAVQSQTRPRAGSAATRESGDLLSFDLPRICNHCLNPACVAACPSGALYKRAEDGVVLVDQERCRAWKACIPACPYKKVFYNWTAGKSQKCTFCYPRVEAGKAPLCFQSCVGGVPLTGPLFYDADRIGETAALDSGELLEGSRSLILDPSESAVADLARKNGIPEALIESARNSPPYRCVIEWKIALPLRGEYRTLPMVFYIPPLSALDVSQHRNARSSGPGKLSEVEPAGLGYLSQLFSLGKASEIRQVADKLLAVRAFRASQRGDGPGNEVARRRLEASGLSPRDADDIFQLLTLARPEARLVGIA